MKNFTQQLNNWTYLLEETEEHTKETEKFSCILFLDDDYHKPKFLISKKRENFYSIEDIFYSQRGTIPMLEYNPLLRLFKQDFQVFLKSGKYKSISVKLSNEDIGLNEIISSPKARDFFEKYLCFRPQSYHANDKERLDYFICAASRYSKKKDK